MYKFSKQSWHVKLFKWIFNEDPTRIYRSMCPYFWSYILILIFLPAILVVKLFGKWGTNFLNVLRTYKEVRREKTKKEFLEKCRKENLTKKEAYGLVNSKCWSRFAYYLNWEEENSIYELFREVKEELQVKSSEVKYKRQTQYKEVKESKWFPYVSYIVTAGVLSAIIWLFYNVFSNIEFLTVDWKLVGSIFMLIGLIVLTVFTIIVFFKFIIAPIYDRVKCMECQLCKLRILSNIGKFLLFIWKGFCIVGDMIHVTYKKNCPLIEWEETKNN